MKSFATLLLFLLAIPSFADNPSSTEDDVAEVLSHTAELLVEERERFLQEGLESLERTSRVMDQFRGALAQHPTVEAAEAIGTASEGTSLDELFQRYESARTANTIPAEAESLLLFISFSMPADVIREYSRQAQATGATLVLRGNYQGQTVRKTTEVAQHLNAGGAGWIINPELYTGYKIDAVPALVLSRTNLEADEEGCFPLGSYAAVFGEISIIGSLEKIARDATDPVIRSLARARLSAINGS